MAGSPGAGKTETSKRLIETFKSKPVRIDADEIREFVPGYDGMRAYVYQRAADKGVNILYDHALHKNLNLILDGTFAYGGAADNVDRSLKRKRKVIIYYIYQEPKKAWEMVLAREAIQHRKVSRKVFTDLFILARSNVDKIKDEFSVGIQLNLIMRDFDTNKERIEINISSLDQYLPKVYNEKDLEKLL